MNTKTFLSTAAVAAIGLALLMVTGFTATVAANGCCFQYGYDQTHHQVTMTTPSLDIRVTTGGEVPHFLFWNPNATDMDRVTYHVMFNQLLEFVDSDEDGTYTPGTDMLTSQVFSLSGIHWDFSGFTTDTDANGTITAVHFNFTTDSVPIYGFQDLFIQLRCHVTIEELAAMKFDVVISGWPWARSDSYLALRWDITVQYPGMSEVPAQVTVEENSFIFGDAYFSYTDTALVDGTTTVTVTGSLEAKHDGTRVYLVYPNFGDGVLEHDPTLGLSSTSTTTTTGGGTIGGLPVLLVVGVGALACAIIAVSVWLSRRR